MQPTATEVYWTRIYSEGENFTLEKLEISAASTKEDLNKQLQAAIEASKTKQNKIDEVRSIYWCSEHIKHCLLFITFFVLSIGLRFSCLQLRDWYFSQWQLNGQFKEAQSQNRKQESSIKDLNNELTSVKEKNFKLEQDFKEKVSGCYFSH